MMLLYKYYYDIVNQQLKNTCLSPNQHPKQKPNQYPETRSPEETTFWKQLTENTISMALESIVDVWSTYTHRRINTSEHLVRGTRKSQKQGPWAGRAVGRLSSTGIGPSGQRNTPQQRATEVQGICHAHTRSFEAC